MSATKSEPSYSMAVFNGLLAIRQYLLHHADVPLQEIVVSLRRISPDDAYHNYDQALALHELVPSHLDSSNPSLFFREVLSLLISQQQPWWLRLAAYGRKKLLSGLSDNEYQCFEAAGLLEEPPSTDIVAWWDRIAALVRMDQDARRHSQGRYAENLSMEYERGRLITLGISESPRLIAIEDNSAGYDIHSYNQGLVGPVAKLIEVKSSRTQPPQIFLTRTEWNTALDREPNYIFHVWLLPEEQLIELTLTELSSHIPENRGTGVWEIVRILLPPK